MLTKQLYRYIFGNWDALTNDEIIAIPKFFASMKNNNELRQAIHVIGSRKLIESIYGKETQSYYHYYIPSDEQIKKSFDIYDGFYHFYSKQQPEKYFSTYKTIYKLFSLIHHSFNFGSTTSENVDEYAYRFLVLFGGEANIENALEMFDLHCIGNEITVINKIVTEGLKYQFKRDQRHDSIRLPEWRTIISQYGLDVGMKLFTISPEIEAVLGRAPANYEEALKVAKAIVYKSAEKYPQLTALCVLNFIPEYVFDQCVSIDAKIRQPARGWVLKQLKNEDHAAFVHALPEQEFTIEEILSLAECLQGNGQIEMINRFGSQFSNIAKTRHEFTRLLEKFTNPIVQQRIFDLLGQVKIRAYYEDNYDLRATIERVESTVRDSFIENVIGREKVIALTKNEVNYEGLLSTLLPKKNSQIDFLLRMYGKDLIANLITNHCHLVDQVKHIHKDERFLYLTTFVEPDKLRSILCKNWCMLQSVLEPFTQPERLKLMYDIIGLDELRNIIPMRRDKRAQNAILNMLPYDWHQNFLNTLITDEEKAAKIEVLKLKKTIIDTIFSVGIMGWGGVDITLPNGETKTVPTTVGKQWDYIKYAEDETYSHVDAWNEISKLGKEAANSIPFISQPTTIFTYLSRSNSTVDYYNQFLVGAKDMQPELNNKKIMN